MQTWEESNPTLPASEFQSAAKRVALGTAQFGMAYGVANIGGQVSARDAERMLAYAYAAGVDMLDTAVAYGDAERMLGEIGVGRWRIVSKIPAVPEECADVAGWMEYAVTQSLERLGVPRLDGVLLHEPAQLLTARGDRVHSGLQRLKACGLARRVGVSVYNPAELGRLWPRYSIDMVQAPLNVFDQRLCRSGMLDRLTAASVDVQVRSVFLQGLLLMAPNDRPRRFQRFSIELAAWDDWLDSTGQTAVSAALGYAFGVRGIDRIVMGVDNLAQLAEVLAVPAAPAIQLPARLVSDDEALIDPRRWNAT